jgi:hypothetical protein
MRNAYQPAGASGDGPAGRPEDRHLGAFEERLLAELMVVVAEQAAPAGSFAPRPRVPRPSMAGLRLPRLRARTVAAATAVTLSAALAAGLAAAGISSSGPAGPPAGRISLDAFLSRAAAVARAQDTADGRPGQIFYVKYLQDVTNAAGATQSCQVDWDPPPSVGGTAGGDSTTIPARPAPQFCASGVPAPPAGYPDPWFADGGYPSFDHNGYPPPATLPAQPAALLGTLDQAAARGWQYWGVTFGPAMAEGAVSTPDVVFELIDRLLQAPISSQLRAALYQVTARLPGVELIRNVTDAAGRRGTEIAMAHDDSAQQSPSACDYGVGFAGFILDPATYRYLGERDVTKWTPRSGHCPSLSLNPPHSRPTPIKVKLRLPLNDFPQPPPWPLAGTTFTVTAVLQTGFIDTSGS